MGAPQVTDTNWLSSVLAVTMDQYTPNCTDNVFNNNAATLLLKEKSQVDARLSSYQIQVPIMLGKNTSVKSFTGYDGFDNSPQKGIVNAYVPLANYGGLITISDDEIEMNSDKEQVVNILTTKIMQCESSILDAINTDIYLDGTGNGGKNILGLMDMCEASATPSSYMGLTNSTYWVNQYSTASTVSVLSALTELYFKCTDGREIPDIILANTDFVTAYEAANRTTSGVGLAYVNAKLADAGFASLGFKNIPMVLDKSLDGDAADSGGYGKAFMLNSKFLGMPFKEVKTTAFTDSDTQFAKTAKMRVRLQLLTDKRRRQGVCVLSTSA